MTSLQRTIRDMAAGLPDDWVMSAIDLVKQSTVGNPMYPLSIDDTWWRMIADKQLPLYASTSSKMRKYLKELVRQINQVYYHELTEMDQYFDMTVLLLNSSFSQ